LFLCNLTKAYFELNLDRSEPMIKNDTKFLNLDRYRVRKVNRTHHLLVGDYVVKVDIDESFDTQTLLYQKAGNDYKLMPFRLKKQPFCAMFQSDFMKDFLKV